MEIGGAWLRAEEARDQTSFRFNGRGYAELSQIARYDPRQYSVTFSFRSLDEHSLLFLAVNETVVSFNIASRQRRTAPVHLIGSFHYILVIRSSTIMSP